ncbi:hypothetical protein EXE30_11200 [Acinetobacter halotolerans]|uniref:DUF3131 domain-containing protein n=1 Tax=Acinetobacter halotolerans TaxID=1752076 RepID=A0A4Q6XGM6_9GAMM|nr:hypothetical protein [Acinetobacter halotolerans]RZF51137.1 hypothetical protein EXE30_11200 [Acinetobacter halotolerans]
MIIRIVFLYIILILSRQVYAQDPLILGAEAYLSLDTWNTNERYNASHALMVPLHYAYKHNNQPLKKDFESNVSRFLKVGKNEINIRKKEERLSGLQYLYFLSEYVGLNENKELADYLLIQVRGIWNDIPAWQWGREPFNNMKERISWKLQANKDVGYKRIIIDEEFFSFGIAANLTKIYPKDPVLKEINQYALEVFKQRSHFEDGRWLFDKGNYDDYKDHAFAGYVNKFVKEKRPLTGMVSDSSHFFRMPKILSSLQYSYPIGSYNFNLYKSYRKGLTKQFLNKVVHIRDNKIYLTNYMDGRNGIYRWEYPSLGKGNGYGPYELTGSFSIGWWGFLENKEVSNLYYKYYRMLRVKDDKGLCQKIIEETKQKQSILDSRKFHNCVRIYNSYMASKL